MIGKVAYAVVFVNGPDDRSIAESEMTRPTADMQESLKWYAGLDPRAHLSWFPEIHTVTIKTKINASTTDLETLEAVWRDPVMKALGFPGANGVVAFAQSLRHRLKTDWAFVTFFTKYPIGGRDGANAYAAAPRIVVGVDPEDGGFPLTIKALFAHEVGHIFGCLDEYVTSGCDCSEVSGYLDVPNGNCATCNKTPEICVMFHEDLELCAFSREQLGWRDSNGNGILDPEDVGLTVVATETTVFSSIYIG